jgi:DNA-binding CsgD family transcriptional regulator
VLLERSVECQRIDEVLRGVRDGESTVLVVRGDAGLGKTALLEYAALGASGMTVLSCRGFESESQLAFAGLGGLLRPVAQHLSALPDAQRRALEGALSLGPAVDGDRLTVYVAVLSLLTAVAEASPVLAVVEDAHWLDLASAEALSFVGRRLVAEGVVLLLAVRDGEDGGFGGREFATIELAPLSSEAARALVEPVIPGHSDRVVALAAGNPLALIELGQAVALDAGALDDASGGAVVGSVRTAFLRRIGRLAPASRRALLVVAAADDEDAGMIARALAVQGLALTDLEPAERAGLIELGAGHVGFGHPLCRSAVYTSAGAADRRAGHAALAAAMVEARYAEMRAWHLAAAALEPDEEIAVALDSSGRRARSMGAYASAVAAFERSASMSPATEARGSRLVMAADAAHMVGQSAHALELLDQAGTFTSEEADQAAVERLRGRVEARSGSSANAYQLLRSAAQRLEPSDPRLAALALVEAVEAAIRSGCPGEALEIADHARSLIVDPSDPVAVFATLATAASCVFLGDSGRGLELVRSAAGAAQDVALDEQIRGYLGMVLAFSEEFDDARTVLVDLVQDARDRSAPGALAFPLVSLGWVDRTTGRWRDAVANLHEAIGLASELQRKNDECWALSVLAWIEAGQGSAESCRAHVSRQLELQDALGLPFQLAAANATLGMLELGAGRVDVAIDHLVVALEVKHHHGYCDATTYPCVAPDLVEALVRVGRVAEAREIQDRFSLEAEASGRLSAHALAHRGSGLLAGEEGFETEFELALDAHTGARDVFAHARTELCYGGALRRAGKRRDSRAHLDTAREMFDTLGATPWSALASDGLDRGAQSPRRRDDPLSDAPTPAEWQVAAAVERGLTNKEIGAQLFMSHKTVESHLTHLYGKLGLRRRTELARWFRGQRPPPPP